MEETVNDRLNTFVNKCGISANQFAKKIGVSQPSLKAILDGDTKPSYSTIEKVLIAYPISAEWLILGTGEMNRKGEGVEIKTNTSAVIKALERIDEALKTMKVKNEELEKKVEKLESGDRGLIGKNEEEKSIAAEKPAMYGSK